LYVNAILLCSGAGSGEDGLTGSDICAALRDYGEACAMGYKPAKSAQPEWTLWLQTCVGDATSTAMVSCPCPAMFRCVSFPGKPDMHYGAVHHAYWYRFPSLKRSLLLFLLGSQGCMRLSRSLNLPAALRLPPKFEWLHKLVRCVILELFFCVHVL
jgi:hypothetical protein